MVELLDKIVDDCGDEHAIREGFWEISFGGVEVYTYTITQYDNTAGILIAENGSDTGSEAGYWSRFDWTYTYTSTGDLYASSGASV